MEKLSENLEKIRDYYEEKIEAVYEEEAKNRKEMEDALEEKQRDLGRLADKVKVINIKSNILSCARDIFVQ